MPDYTDPVLRRAVKFLGHLLYFANGAHELPAKEVFEAAELEGVSELAVRRAQEALRIKPRKESGTHNGPWLWRLPDSYRPDEVKPDRPTKPRSALKKKLSKEEILSIITKAVANISPVPESGARRVRR